MPCYTFTTIAASTSLERAPPGLWQLVVIQTSSWQDCHGQLTFKGVKMPCCSLSSSLPLNSVRGGGCTCTRQIHWGSTVHWCSYEPRHHDHESWCICFVVCVSIAAIDPHVKKCERKYEKSRGALEKYVSSRTYGNRASEPQAQIIYIFIGIMSIMHKTFIDS